MSETIQIGANDITTYYHARVVADSIEISGTPVTTAYVQGRNRTNFIFQTAQYGMKTIKFRVAFCESTRALCEQYKTELLLACTATANANVKMLKMPDGYYYRSLLKKIGKEEWLGSEDNGGILLFFDLEFEGIQQSNTLQNVLDGRTSFTAVGTFPRMDARLTVQVTANASSYTLFGATFGSVTAGDILVFDGIDKRILKNGSPTVVTGYFEFPYVKAGTNQFTGNDPIKVEYYPCYL